MIAALIEYFTDYDYDYKFYAMVDGAKFSFLEKLFIYTVFYIDFLIAFATAAISTYLVLFFIVWVFGGM